jgi:hypothetical protein
VADFGDAELRLAQRATAMLDVKVASSLAGAGNAIYFMDDRGSQLIEARKLSLVDVANIFNLDAYWLSAPGATLTYKTAAPQYQQILRTSLEPVLVDFESVWSAGWLPRGQIVRFDRKKLLRDDLPTTMTAAVAGFGAGIITVEEARTMLDLPPEPEVGELGPPRPPPMPAPMPVAAAPVDSGAQGGNQP